MDRIDNKLENDVDRAITGRRSVRRFLDKPVPDDVLRHILEVSKRAPSGTNIQPWQVWVVTGDAKDRVVAAIHKAYDTEPREHEPEFSYYPKKFPEPYLSRRRKVGWDLYQLLGLGRRDIVGMKAQQRRNFQFFDAPVGIFFSIDRDLEKGSWLDYGMFLGNIVTAARGQGLHTCVQAAFSAYHRVIRAELDIPYQEMIFCGLALGYEDEDAPENHLRTEREDLDNIVTFFTK